MTDTPDETPLPDAIPNEPAAPAGAAAPAAQSAPAPPSPAALPPSAASGAPPAAAMAPFAGPDPFLARARAPRTPWVNPVRRLHVGAALLAIALIFGGAGVAVGWAASDSHGGGEFIERMGPAGGPGGRWLPRSDLPIDPNLPTPSTATSTTR